MEKFKVLQRMDSLKTIEAKVKYKWNWSWVEERDDNGDFLSVYLRKIDQPGLASCTWCTKHINYGSSGKKSIKAHASKEVHKKNREARKNAHQELPTIF